MSNFFTFSVSSFQCYKGEFANSDPNKTTVPVNCTTQSCLKAVISDGSTVKKQSWPSNDLDPFSAEALGIKFERTNYDCGPPSDIPITAECHQGKLQDFGSHFGEEMVGVNLKGKITTCICTTELCNGVDAQVLITGSLLIMTVLLALVL